MATKLLKRAAFGVRVMALNRACIGKSYPPMTSEVTFDASRKYAVKDDHPRHFDPVAPGGIVAPPMLNVVLSWLPLLAVVADRALNADLLHLPRPAQKMQFFAPLRPGDRITPRVWRRRARGDRTDFLFETSNPEGLAVIRWGRAELLC